MMQHSVPHVIITSNSLDSNKFQNIASKMIFLEDIKDEVMQHNNSDLNIEINLKQLAYMKYMSGSTEEPKEGMIAHHALLACMERSAKDMEIKRGTCVAQFASLGFDAMLIEIFATLLYGGTIYIVPRDESGKVDTQQLEKFYENNAIEVAIFTSSFLSVLNPIPFSKALRALVST